MHTLPDDPSGTVEAVPHVDATGAADGRYVPLGGMNDASNDDVIWRRTIDDDAERQRRKRFLMWYCLPVAVLTLGFGVISGPLGGARHPHSVRRVRTAARRLGLPPRAQPPCQPDDDVRRSCAARGKKEVPIGDVLRSGRLAPEASSRVRPARPPRANPGDDDDAVHRESPFTGRRSAGSPSTGPRTWRFDRRAARVPAPRRLRSPTNASGRCSRRTTTTTLRRSRQRSTERCCPDAGFHSKGVPFGAIMRR